MTAVIMCSIPTSSCWRRALQHRQLYDELPARIATYAFSDAIDTPIMRARHGDFQRSARCRVALADRVTNGDGLPGACVLKIARAR